MLARLVRCSVLVLCFASGVVGTSNVDWMQAMLGRGVPQQRPKRHHMLTEVRFGGGRSSPAAGDAIAIAKEHAKDMVKSLKLRGANRIIEQKMKELTQGNSDENWANMDDDALKKLGEAMKFKLGVEREQLKVFRQHMKVMDAAHGLFRRPMVVHAGPMADLGFGGMMNFQDVFERAAQLEDPLQGFRQNVFALLDSQVQSQQARSGFHVVEEDGHFKLRASLPWYKMHARSFDDAEDDQPLNVEVIGNSLVVRGRHNDGQMEKMFQRSFKLPKGVDSSAMKVTYSVNDGGLAVAIPRAEEDPEEGGKVFDPQEEGSMTTLVVTAKGGEQDQEEEGAAVAPQQNEALANTALSDANTVAGAGFAVGSEAARPIADPDAAPADTKTPVVVQQSDAKPFWRLTGNDGGRHSFIEIVLPQGVDMGEPGGNVISFLGGQTPLRLPVSINGEDCTFLEGGASGERVLRCKIKDSTVKKLPIKVEDEL